MTTVKEMRSEIKALNKYLFNNFDHEVKARVMNRKDELFLAKGYETKNLRAAARKEEVQDYLKCLIEAFGDCHIDLDNFYYYDED